MAVDLTTGTVIEASHQSGDGRRVPARIDRLIRRRNGSVFAHVTHLISGEEGTIRWDGHQRVTVLPTHYGVCLDCQALAPCPHEQRARRAAESQSASDPVHDLETSLRRRAMHS